MVTTRLLQDYVRLMIEAIRTKKGVKSKMGEKFSLQKFKSLPNSEIMIQYANQYLDKLGEGSSRIAFLLSSKYVLKVALNKKGLAQNKAELEVFTNPTSKNVVAKIYGSDDASQWVIADLVRPVKSPEEFEQLSGQDWEDFVKYVGPAIKEPERVPDSHKWLKAVAITARENNLLRGDLEEIDHWGRTPDGRCVLLDYGFTHEVWASHYSQKTPDQLKSVDKTAAGGDHTGTGGRGLAGAKTSGQKSTPGQKTPLASNKTMNVRSDEIEPEEDLQKTRR